MSSLARQLAKRHEVTVLTSRTRDLPEESIEDGVRICRVPVLFRRQRAVANFPSMLAYVPMGILRGNTLARDRQFDVVNTHFVVPTGPVGHILSRFYGMPNVLSVHGGDLYDPSKRLSPHRHAPLRAAVRFLLGNADVVVGQSRDTLQRVRDIYGVNRAMELVPLGIDRPTLTTPALRADFHLPRDAFVMITIGRLVARKNTSALVKALFSSRLRNTYLVIVGDGPDVEHIQRTATEAGLADRVRLLGALSDRDKYRALSIADAFVSASSHEGFGMVFLEAMAFGLPVVCFDHGGQTDFLEHGRTGHVLKLDDQAALARAMIELQRDVPARLAMGRYNRTLVEKYFIDTCAARYEQIFADAIDPTARHARERQPQALQEADDEAPLKSAVNSSS